MDKKRKRNANCRLMIFINRVVGFKPGLAVCHYLIKMINFLLKRKLIQ